MKKLMYNMENLFCIGYLLFAFAVAVIFLCRGGTFYLRCAVMTLLLAGGDAFHLIPRIIGNRKPEWPDKERWLGLGNLISSITITFFYVALAFVMDSYHPGLMQPAIPLILMIISVVRTGLCAVPSNNWFGNGGSQSWRMRRNLPFLLIGVITVIYLIVLYREWLLSALVIVSFICYMVTVMGVKKNPRLGMLMIPKTVCYIWMVVYFL